MSIVNSFTAELKRESVSTRKLLERVPQEKFDWQPHDKSMKLLRLAAHIAEIPGLFATGVAQAEELDFTKSNYKQPAITTTQELLTFFDETLQKALSALPAMPEEDMEKTWTMRNGETVIMALPKKAVIRTLCLNHIYHHRGQLSVYLRLLDVAVPSVYGPTADESIF